MNTTSKKETTEQAVFRKHCREFLDKEIPALPDFRLPQSPLEIMTDEQMSFLVAWQKKAYHAGLVGCDYPTGYGGGGLADCQRIANEEMIQRPEWIVAGAGSAKGALEKAEPAIFTMMAADMAGAGEWQLQTTASYAKRRVQFDRPIGFFQAVKHPIVNMMLMVDEAKSLVVNAACAIDHEPDKRRLFAHMAKASANEMAFFCSDRSVQLLGGMGFTWECPVQIYFKRQLHHRMLFGDSRYHRAAMAELMMGSD